MKRAGAELVAAKMSIRVNDVPDGTIELRPMTEDRFERFIDAGIEHYAHSIFDAGGFETIETARLASLEEHKRLLPQGLQSPGHRSGRPSTRPIRRRKSGCCGSRNDPTTASSTTSRWTLPKGIDRLTTPTHAVVKIVGGKIVELHQILQV
ncbi:hypothetical protein GCM10022376_17140 [Yimella lutea]